MGKETASAGADQFELSLGSRLINNCNFTTPGPDDVLLMLKLYQ